MNRVADAEFGKEVGLIHKVIVTGRKAGATRIFWTTLADNEKLFRKLVGLVNTELTFDIWVNYNRSLAEMIEAGNYDRVHPKIKSSHFPVRGRGQHRLSIYLVHFNRDIGSDDVVIEMSKQGYRPITIEELLALGEHYPNLQKKFPIFAYGSIWEDQSGRCYVPVLEVIDSSERYLDIALLTYSSEWVEECRFAAVRLQDC